MSKSDEDRVRWFAEHRAAQLGCSVEEAARIIEQKRAAQAAAIAQNTQPEPQTPPEPPVQAPAPSQRPATAASELQDSELTAEEERLMMECNYGRELPMPKREAVEMPLTGFLPPSHPDFVTPPAPARDPDACPDCRPGYKAPSCTGMCWVWWGNV